MNKHLFLGLLVFGFFAMPAGSLRSEQYESKEIKEAREQYEQRVIQAKKTYEGVLDRETDSQKKRGNLSIFLEFEKELKHTQSEPGADFSDYKPDNRTIANAKARYKKEAETAQGLYQRKLESLVKEYVQAGAIDDAKTVQHLLDGMDSQKPIVVKSKRSKSPVYQVVRLTMEIAADGKGRCALSRGLSSDPVSNHFQGEPFSLSAFPHAAAFRDKQGSVRVVWTFEDPLDAWKNAGWINSGNIDIDLDRNVLAHGVAIPPKDAHFQISKTVLSFPVRFCADIAEGQKAGVFLTFWGTTEQGRRGVRVHFWRNPDGSYRIGLEIRKGNQPNKIDLVDELFFVNNLTLKEPFVRSFQLSPEVTEMKSIQTDFNRMSSNGIVPRIDYTAPFSASAGFTIRNDGENIVVDKVDEKGPARRAGMLVGDVIETFKNRKATENDVKKSLETGSFGDPLTLTVLRNGKNVNFRFHLE